MATGVDIEERWGFLEPWTRVLKRQFSNDLCRLQLSPFDPAQLYVNFTDQDEAQMTQEGIKLLAAVAFVDYNAWKYLLHSHCGVKIDVEGDIIVRFQLRIYSNKQTVTDLVQMCGIQQHYRPRREYSDALSRIAQKLHTRRRGKEILVPIEVFVVEKPQGLRKNLEEILRKF